jgi:hypothetical protein
MTFPNDSSRIARGLANLEASANDYTTDSKTAARSVIRKTYCITQVASVLANGADAIVANAAPSIYFKNPVRIMGVTVQNRVALTANVVNYATFALKPVSNIGVLGNTIASITTKPSANSGCGNLVAGQKFSLVVDTSNSNDRVAAGKWVGVDISQTASGVAVGATSWAIDVEEEGPDGYTV